MLPAKGSEAALDFFDGGNYEEDANGAIEPNTSAAQHNRFRPLNDLDRSQSDSDIFFTDFDNEPPLLEELGINFGNIWLKTLYVLIPRKNPETNVLSDGDLAGPILFSCILGFCLLCAGKVHFGYIYGFNIIGCFAVNLMLNLMCSDQVKIDMLHTVSIIGYCVLPIIFLSAINIVLNLQGQIGFVLSTFFVLWSAFIATRFFEKLTDMSHQRYLILYPMALFYACFALITVF
mmetsp:Transcript_60272/g.99488  ORF Transcript_60272/g.99488 Transcript_60272/m.99488 type:complete len:233 (-) Transcript_60272:41-739(-)|eukprot:CAMPEP_0202706072 /NCGR_PEP_ID=MMETSP1385-20130828/18551_1 /ASSEMBLY_ACC=CAM_ASM_000861 /TAXON_ID=933848 /ORGANISM="Elphidium margaritaceum" /LENGTH=232 /DNA_ID=CAMNT_0049364457 /DNA_START=28 /DNA_END=726 /DNA_ORIENTATION=-